MKRHRYLSPRLTPPFTLPNKRRGAVAVWGMICLVLATAMAATLGRVMMTGFQVVLQDHRRSQCEWLVESGWSLALSRQKDDPKYVGETWNLSPESLGAADGGQVVIEVVPVATDEGSAGVNATSQLRITARYPQDSVRQVQITALKPWPQQ